MGSGSLKRGDLPTRIEVSYARRFTTLTGHARRLLVVAAAEPVGDPLLLRDACSRLEIDLAAIDATDGLLTMDERVTFRHPLARSAVYRAADGPERRAAHLALAQVTDRHADPDRRAWHLAAAATGPDEEVAHELELLCRSGQGAGGQAAAAAFLQRAVALTGNPAQRAGRALEAAQANLAARCVRHRSPAPEHRSGRATGRARTGSNRPAPGRDRVRPATQWRRCRSCCSSRRRKLEPLDTRLARNTYLDAWGAALFAGHLADDGGTLLDVSACRSDRPETG